MKVQISAETTIGEKIKTPAPPLKHNNRIVAMLFSRDGKILVSVDQDHAIKYWHAENYQCIKTIADQRHTNAAAFSPNEKLIVSSHFQDGTSTFFDGIKAKSIKTIQHSFAIAEFSQDGKFLIGKTNDFYGEVMLWNRIGNPIKTSISSKSSNMVFFPDGETYVGWAGNGIVIYDNSTFTRTFLDTQAHYSSSMILSSDTKLLAVANSHLWDENHKDIYMPSLQLFEVATGKSLISKDMKHNLLSISYSPDEKIYARSEFCKKYGEMGSVTLHRAGTDEQFQTIFPFTTTLPIMSTVTKFSSNSKLAIVNGNEIKIFQQNSEGKFEPATKKVNNLAINGTIEEVKVQEVEVALATILNNTTFVNLAQPDQIINNDLGANHEVSEIGSLPPSTGDFA